MKKFNLNKQLIIDLQTGKLAIDNRGNPNLELLRAVLTEAFPKDLSTPNGTSEYYELYHNNKWGGRATTNLSTIPLLDFLEKEETFPIHDFGVVVENGNGKEIVAYLVSKGFDADGCDGCVGSNHYYCVKLNSKKLSFMFKSEGNPTSKTYTLQQLTQLNMQKEIIGYKAPMDLFNGKVKKNTMYVKNYHYGYVPTHQDIGLNIDTAPADVKLPPEIVESWEPVYREDKKLPKINGYEGKVEGDFIIYGNNCAKFHKKFFKDLQQLIIHNHNSVQNRAIKSIKLDSGVEITMDEVKQIVDYIN